MVEIINLRRARKAKARAQAGEQAAANRVAFGRSKAEKEASKAVQSLEAQRLDGHRRERQPAEFKPGDE
jgi:hypothetical protein